MTDSVPRGRRFLRAVVAVALLASAACAGKKEAVPPDPAVADQFLFMRGNEELAEKHWVEAREYFRQIVDNYPGSMRRTDAKLALGDAYLGEKSAESLVLAANEYREFLTFYPTNARADYAQYKLAMTYFEQMHPSDRDQTPTKEALAEFSQLFERFPGSPLIPEARQSWRIARDRLSDYSYGIAVGYYRRSVSFCPPTVSRLREIMRDDPEYTGISGVYYYLAECLVRGNQTSEAIPLLHRIVTEHVDSEYTERAQRRLKQLQTP